MSDNQNEISSTEELVQKTREERGLTQAELADELNVSPPTISNWEHGKTEPTPDQQDRLQELLTEGPETIDNPPCDKCDVSYVPYAVHTVAIREGDEIIRSVLCHWCSKETTVKEAIRLAR